MGMNELVPLSLGTAFPSHPLHHALCVNAKPPLFLPSSPLWQSLLGYHLPDQPCQCFHSSSSRACMKIARVPQATTAASGNQLRHSGRKIHSALVGDLGCPGSQLSCVFWPQTTCSGAQRGNGREETPWSQIIRQYWGCHIVPSL